MDDREHLDVRRHPRARGTLVTDYSPPDRITLWMPAPHADDAVWAAKRQARTDGWRVLKVVNVAYKPGEHGALAWNVTLMVQRHE
jgi:hypothetical protein